MASTTDSTSILSRKKDLTYLIYFLLHLPIMLLFDLQPLYPAHLIPTWMSDVQSWYITTYGDQFFVSPPAFFSTYSLMEALYHIPLTLWAIPALLRNDPRIPLLLLVYGTQVALTTLTCMAEMMSWADLTAAQRGVTGLGGMYGSYLALGVFMAVDMFARLDATISRVHGLTPISKNKDL